jgi:DNA-binding LacI/PurR family transcriptional regulator
VAAGALEVLREAGRAVPAEVGLVGFDDSTWALRTLPPLSTVHQPAREIGAVAADLVLRQIAGAHPEPVVLPSPVVWRQSA